MDAHAELGEYVIYIYITPLWDEDAIAATTSSAAAVPLFLARAATSNLKGSGYLEPARRTTYLRSTACTILAFTVCVQVDSTALELKITAFSALLTLTMWRRAVSPSKQDTASSASPVAQQQQQQRGNRPEEVEPASQLTDNSSVASMHTSTTSRPSVAASAAIGTTASVSLYSPVSGLLRRWYTYFVG